MFYDFHHVVVHDFFIHIEVHFFQYPDGFILLLIPIFLPILLILLLVKRRSAHWTRGPWIRFVPFQQARNAKQVPTHGVRVIGADLQPGSAYAAIANTIIR
jgi:hypothetical protein